MKSSYTYKIHSAYYPPSLISPQHLINFSVSLLVFSPDLWPLILLCYSFSLIKALRVTISIFLISISLSKLSLWFQVSKSFLFVYQVLVLVWVHTTFLHMLRIFVFFYRGYQFRRNYILIGIKFLPINKITKNIKIYKSAAIAYKF